MDPRRALLVLSIGMASVAWGEGMLELITKAKAGNAEAQYQLGVMHGNGDGVLQDQRRRTFACGLR